MNNNRIKIYQPNNINGSGSLLKDDPFGPSWNGDTTHGATRNALWDFLITIGAGFGNSAYVRTGGNDSTGVVGNFLLPFATIAGAMNAIGMLGNSAIIFDSGNYDMFDFDCPYGLRPPGAQFDIYCNVGVTINYYGSYGMYCSDGFEGTRGNIFGYGNFKSYSSICTKSIDGVNNFAFNWNASSGTYVYEFNTITQETTSATVGLFRIGNCNSIVGAAQINVRNRCYSRGATVFVADTGSRCLVFGSGTYDAVVNGYAFQITNPTTFTLRDTTVTSRGTAFGNSNLNYCVNISNGTNASIKFINVALTCINSPAGYVMVNFSSTTPTMDNLLFKNCEIRSRQSTLFSSSGYAFKMASNISFKIVDTYGELDFGGAGAFTNLISTGNGYMKEPNIV